MKKSAGRIVSVLLAGLLIFGIMPSAVGEADTVCVDFVVYNNLTGMTLDAVFVEAGQSPADKLPVLPQYVTDASGVMYKKYGWYTDPGCTAEYVPSPVTEGFTLYAKYVTQHLIVLYSVDPAGNELPFPDFDAYVRKPGVQGAWFDEGAEVGITAVAKNGFRFVEWRYARGAETPQEICQNGALLSRNAEDTIRMNSDIYCVAVFTCAGHVAGEAVKENEVAATCRTDGSYDCVTYCAVCGEELSRETIAVAAGHDFGEWTTVTPAACTADGEQIRFCGVCGESEAQTIPALGHEDADNDGRCDRCGEKMQGGGRCALCGRLHDRSTFRGFVTALFHTVAAYIRLYAGKAAAILLRIFTRSGGRAEAYVNNQ